MNVTSSDDVAWVCGMSVLVGVCGMECARGWVLVCREIDGCVNLMLAPSVLAWRPCFRRSCPSFSSISPMGWRWIMLANAPREETINLISAYDQGEVRTRDPIMRTSIMVYLVFGNTCDLLCLAAF